MATPKSQRIGIWIIAIVMVVGTLGSFAVMILSNKNQQNDLARQNETYAEYEKQQQKAAEESAKTAEPLEGYQAEAFDPASVTELKTEVLSEGDGQIVTSTDTINVSYFGWIPSGKIFDSTTREGKNTPIDISLAQVIPGWTEGIKDQKVGSTIKLTIPAEKAYGAQSSGIIPANTPLVFILTINGVTKAEN